MWPYRGEEKSCNCFLVLFIRLELIGFLIQKNYVYQLHRILTFVKNVYHFEF